jgi:hypothetical protein
VKYQSAAAFRTALEQRLLARSRSSGASLARLRKLVAFERLLARLVIVAPNRWILKGGLALDFRFGDRARTTMDVDLTRQDDEAAASTDFRAAELADLADYFNFDIGRSSQFDRADMGGAIRYQVRSSLGGRRFEEFVVDVAFADPVISAPDDVLAPDLLAFAGLPRVHVPVLPLHQHVAEKVHAYTRRYGLRHGPSSRVKDLIDLVLLQATEPFRADQLRQALQLTFHARDTHPLPALFPEPPTDWSTPYREIAVPLALPPDLQAAHRAIASLLDPILTAAIDDEARWDPAAGRWAVLTET